MPAPPLRQALLVTNHTGRTQLCAALGKTLKPLDRRTEFDADGTFAINGPEAVQATAALPQLFSPQFQEAMC